VARSSLVQPIDCHELPYLLVGLVSSTVRALTLDRHQLKPKALGVLLDMVDACMGRLPPVGSGGGCLESLTLFCCSGVGVDMRWDLSEVLKALDGKRGRLRRLRKLVVTSYEMHGRFDELPLGQDHPLDAVPIPPLLQSLGGLTVSLLALPSYMPSSSSRPPLSL
jgi:hypothetical protein